VKRSVSTVILGCLLLFAAPAVTAKPPATWDGLVQVKSKRLDLVYLQPGADFRGYSKVMLDATEVAFAKDWQRNYNRSAAGFTRVSESELQTAVAKGVTAASDIFAEAWSKGGYQIVSSPGPDVLRVTTGVVNINVNAPDRPTAGRSYTYSSDAGSATLVVEARDSMTGALLGRAVDQRILGDSGPATWRTSVSNRADFRDVVKTWASASVRGLAELKSLSPISP
jgi:hypothetical protein